MATNWAAASPAATEGRRLSAATGFGRVLATLAAAAVVATIFGTLLTAGGVFNLVVVIVGAVGLVVLFAVPVQWVPSIAILLYSVAPITGILPTTGFLNLLPMMAMINMIWVFRRVILGHSPTKGGQPADPAPVVRHATGRYVVWLLSLALISWCVLSIPMSLEPRLSIGWTTAFTVSVFAPMLVIDARAEVRKLRTVLLWAGAYCGAYALLETALQASPLYGTFYQLLGVEITDKWSVYRARVSFPHPLFASAFMTIPAGIGIGSWLSGAGREAATWFGRHRDGLLGLVAAIGVVATVSRGAILALAIAGVVAWLLATCTQGPARTTRVPLLLLLGAIGALALTQFAPLLERSESLESELSADARELAFEIALRAAAASDWLGTGPGTSGVAGRGYDDIVIESSALQLLVSIGIPGVVLVVALLGAACAIALARRDLGAVAALVGYVAAISGFNAIDAVRGAHFLIGVLLLLCLHPAQSKPTGQHPQTDSPRDDVRRPLRRPKRAASGPPPNDFALAARRATA